MNTVSLDVHTERTQLCVSSPDGVVLLEKIVPTTREALRRELGAIPGPKKVVFENGHLAGMIVDAVSDIAEEIIACDATRNTLISTAEDSNDRNDARRMGLLARTGSLHPVYVPEEPYRTMRSLVCLETQLTRQMTQFMIRIKAFCRRHGIRYQGKVIYLKRERPKTMEQLPSQAAQAQMATLYRLLDAVRQERIEIRRELRRMTAHMPVVQRLQTVPGVGPIVARILVAWIVDPGRFKSRNALSAYSGLGLKQDITNWKATTHAHASRRGQREIKRVLFLAARATIRGKNNGFARRYQVRISAGWEDRKAIRDIARSLLFTICHVWRTGETYDDARINVPQVQSAN
jgi:transposase